MTVTKEMRSARFWFIYDLAFAVLNLYFGFATDQGYSWFFAGLLIGLAIHQVYVWAIAREEAERRHVLRLLAAHYGESQKR